MATAVVVEQERHLEQKVDVDVLLKDPVLALLPFLRALPGWKRVSQPAAPATRRAAPGARTG
jgi:hypothetical protein